MVSLNWPLGRTNVNQTSDFDIAPPPTVGNSGFSIDAQNISENDGAMKSQPLQPTQSSSNAKSTPDRDTGSATPVSCVSSTAYTVGQGSQQPRLNLSLRGPNLPGIPDIEVELTPTPTSSIHSSSSHGLGDRTMFQAVQSLVQMSAMGSKVL